MSEPLRVGVLVSGGGTNLQAILDAFGRDEAVEVVAVASNRADAPALERAAAAGVPTAAFPREPGLERAQRDAALADWLERHGVRLVVSAGYMELLSPDFLARFPEAVINVHPALLPAFPGLHPIQEALDYGVKVFGVTVHYVDEGVDSGAVILQRAIELPDATDPDEVLARLRPLEHELLPAAIRLVARGAITRDPTNPRRVVIAPND